DAPPEGGALRFSPARKSGSSAGAVGPGRVAGRRPGPGEGVVHRLISHVKAPITGRTTITRIHSHNGRPLRSHRSARTQSITAYTVSAITSRKASNLILKTYAVCHACSRLLPVMHPVHRDRRCRAGPGMYARAPARGRSSTGGCGAVLSGPRQLPAGQRVVAAV